MLYDKAIDIEKIYTAHSILDPQEEKPYVLPDIEKIYTAHSILDPQEEKPYVQPNIKVDCFLFP